VTGNARIKPRRVAHHLRYSAPLQLHYVARPENARVAHARLHRHSFITVYIAAMIPHSGTSALPHAPIMVLASPEWGATYWHSEPRPQRSRENRLVVIQTPEVPRANREVQHEHLLRCGRAAAYMASPAASYGPVRITYIQQLEELRAEWRRRQTIRKLAG